jgi:hypothetical protein
MASGEPGAALTHDWCAYHCGSHFAVPYIIAPAWASLPSGMVERPGPPPQ